MPEVCESVLASGGADLVSMARPFLADPEILNKAAAGNSKSINTCIGCNQACLDHTFKMMRASCLVNPVAGYESTLGKAVALPTLTKKRIAVVGAGPAGLAAAVTASSRGHQVTLFDSATQIGGQFNLAKMIPGKEEFFETIRYFEERIKEEHGLNVRLGTRVGASDLVGLFDCVVLATGIKPRVLEGIPGADHPKVVSYVDVLSGRVKITGSVAIIGAGGIGFDVAEFVTHKGEAPSTTAFMADWGVDMSHSGRGGLLPTGIAEAQQRQVYLLQRKEGKAGATLGRTTGWIHRASIEKNGVQTLTGVQYLGVDDTGLHISLKKGGKRLLRVDHVIVCAGQEPLKELEEPLKMAGIPTFLIGGAECASELDAKRAIDQASKQLFLFVYFFCFLILDKLNRFVVHLLTVFFLSLSLHL